MVALVVHPDRQGSTRWLEASKELAVVELPRAAAPQISWCLLVASAAQQLTGDIVHEPAHLPQVDGLVADAT